MEQLLAFLFKHWYLVIIAITFLYQVGSKRSRGASGSPKRGMPSFGETTTRVPRPSEATNEASRSFGGTEPPNRTADDFGRSHAAKPEAAMPKSKGSPFGSTVQGNTENSPIYANAIASSSAFPDEVKQDQLMQGVIWAEILGPPRSKKPYRR
ncbi:hypothetical protein LOZ80_15930 [Paenibacillus sp. HWE-109]|uniref:hypothetical protein n=1 Tax=Paenibacillus sp. HWE-109 TaxID=1306526 RepID=UPI001EDCAF8A|nr:hypothetical protein [Paenibacillus sp. HWE-109]UKS30338.1 hypothetical protein LOZ80_15930 [Paenibacillus sp. HWE-109]